MGTIADHFMIYTCDNCGTTLEVDGVMGGPLGGPVNWKSIIPNTTTDGDWFCGYLCLSQWAADQHAKQQARAATRVARATAHEAETVTEEPVDA